MHNFSSLVLSIAVLIFSAVSDVNSQNISSKSTLNTVCCYLTSSTNSSSKISDFPIQCKNFTTVDSILAPEQPNQLINETDHSLEALPDINVLKLIPLIIILFL